MFLGVLQILLELSKHVLIQIITQHTKMRYLKPLLP